MDQSSLSTFFLHPPPTGGPHGGETVVKGTQGQSCWNYSSFSIYSPGLVWFGFLSSLPNFQEDSVVDQSFPWSREPQCILKRCWIWYKSYHGWKQNPVRDNINGRLEGEQKSQNNMGVGNWTSYISHFLSATLPSSRSLPSPLFLRGNHITDAPAINN